MKQTKLQKTVELANMALEVAKESLWINNLVGNKWEIVVLDQEGRATNHKEILLWINEWTRNYEIMKMWRQKRYYPQFRCYT